MLPVNGLLLKDTKCISCGQCAVACGVGAIVEHSHIERVQEAMKAGKVVVVQTAPATRVAIAEEFGQTPGTIGTKKMVGGLKVFCAVSSHVLETRLQLRLRYQRRCRYHHHGRGNRVP